MILFLVGWVEARNPTNFLGWAIAKLWS